MKTILLCSLKYDTNLGDMIINNCTKGMLKKIMSEEKKEYIIDEIDLSGRKYFKTKYEIHKSTKLIIKKTLYNLIRIIKTIFKKVKLYKIYNFLDCICWNFSIDNEIFKQIYIDKVKKSDLIIFAGGGLIKYNYLNTYNTINFITKYAEIYNKPVYLNSVGVEGYNNENYKCRYLKKALNRNCVKMITTRDDLKTLKKYIDNNNIITKVVSDPAVNSNIIYNIEKQKKSQTVGLGVCRDNLFIDSGINYDKKDMLELWKQIINELNQKNIKWKIYTNGSLSDNKFAHELLKYLEIKETKEVLELPQNDTDLIKIISKFKGVIATRLHSCIISYSLNIPAIGLVWNNKLKLFGEAINYPERFIEVNNFNSKYIVKKLEKSFKENYDNSKEYRKTDYDAIKESIEKFLK